MEAYREAFEKVFRDHLTQVEQLIARHTKDPDERMDLTQEVFIRAYSAFSQFRGEANVGTWLHRITVNVCTNAARSRKRRREEPLENLEPLDGFEGRLRGDVARRLSLGTFPPLFHSRPLDDPLVACLDELLEVGVG